MNEKGVGNLAKLLVLLLITVTTVSCVWVNRQMKMKAGGYTDVVDRTQFKVESGPILITNVSVLSADGESMIVDQSVFLDNGEISKIAIDIPVSEMPNNLLTINGTGKFLIPGLMDGHIHLDRRANDLLLYFANGITHVRDMGGTEFMLEMREQENNGYVGPDMYIASEKFYSDPGLTGVFREWTRTRINISKPDQVDGEIERLAQHGYDAVKIGGFTSDEIHKALLEASKKYELAVVGHLHISKGLDGLWEGGQSELAHVEEITKAMIIEFGGYGSENASDFLAYVNAHADEVASKLRDHGIAVTSTIWLMESLPRQKFELELALKEIGSNLRYVGPGNLEGTRLAKGWLPGNNSYQLPDEIESDPIAKAQSRVFWDTYVKAIHDMTSALVRNNAVLMAGTDTGTSIVVSGFSLHDELESLAAAGLSNSEALRSATATPGDWLNENTGRVVPSYRANLLLLNSNPLENIGSTRSIEAVIKDGEFYDREQLDAMLDAVIEANDKARSKSIYRFE
ncbi:MAG: imidazolonepropionase-like amidohydrolase [Pseudohongiellaceae bacterium]|jgi:imidazolonepropionase-like amidohydrolase